MIMSMTFEFVLLFSFTILTNLGTSLLRTTDHFYFLNPVTNINFLYENNKTSLVMHLFLELDKVIGRNFNIFQKTWLYWWYEYQILELCLYPYCLMRITMLWALLILPITNKKKVATWSSAYFFIAHLLWHSCTFPVRHWPT